MSLHCLWRFVSRAKRLVRSQWLPSFGSWSSDIMYNPAESYCPCVSRYITFVLVNPKILPFLSDVHVFLVRRPGL